MKWDDLIDEIMLFCEPFWRRSKGMSMKTNRLSFYRQAMPGIVFYSELSLAQHSGHIDESHCMKNAFFRSRDRAMAWLLSQSVQWHTPGPVSTCSFHRCKTPNFPSQVSNSQCTRPSHKCHNKGYYHSVVVEQGCNPCPLLFQQIVICLQLNLKQQVSKPVSCF